MDRQKLFEKYVIDETHEAWDPAIDNWMSVEIYKFVRGELPPPDDMDATFVCEFLDRRHDLEWWAKNVMTLPNWGSMFLTAKRMIYAHCDTILEQLASTGGTNG
jgi:hypothetical protein